MAQTAVCNRHHSLDQQLCRWLLLSLDRLTSNELILTQELIANMLGVRREGVTEAAGRLQDAGLIHYRRGHIIVLDRSGLEARTCECYAYRWAGDCVDRCRVYVQGFFTRTPCYVRYRTDGRRRGGQIILLFAWNPSCRAGV